jgi:hypothetical protein
MTCRGYDPKAVKVPKAIKCIASCYTDNHQRGAFIRGYVRILEEQGRTRSRKGKDE